MKKYSIYIIITLFITSFGCTKKVENAELIVSQNMIQDKTWYLDYLVIESQQKIYTGQSTYFIIFLKNLTTNDSDGVTGVYTFKLINKKLLINVIGKTNGNEIAEYDYIVESIGKKYMVLNVTKNGIQMKYYYSSRN
jgi:hypothetical protein